VIVAILLFAGLNGIIAIHAYKFSHFSSTGLRNEQVKLTGWNKLKLLFLGVDNPRPVDDVLPNRAYQVVTINSNVKIEAWYMAPTITPKGTVILFHGYTSDKSAILSRAEPFLRDGYNCMLVDFMGSGGSGGNETTIGYKEAEEVKDCYNYVAGKGEQHIYLFGSSMGAVAIMKAINDYNITPRSIIIECPFGSMYQAVCARFRMLHLPTVPAGLLVFWGGLENGFWGFSFKPTEYAKKIHCPTLLQYGAHDDRVMREETDAVYANLHCPKKLIVYPEAGHDNYQEKYPTEWAKNITEFLDANR